MITEGHIVRFVEQLRARLVVGEREYGNTSFQRPLGEIVGEIEQELLDVAGWGLIAWTRLQRLRERITRIEHLEQGGRDGA